jgi:raffinose/stachyose/melibiose transport system substrate-binding protein
MKIRKLVTVGAVAAMAFPLLLGPRTNMATAAAPKINITFNAMSGTLDTAPNKSFRALIAQYEHMHPNVTITWQPNTNGQSIVNYDARLVALASAGQAPDIVWEQYGEVTSGSLPKGILADLTPFLNKPNPYAPGNKRWVDLWPSSVLPYMTSPDKTVQILLGSIVEIGIFYNKADFAKAGIKSTPVTWSQWVQDMAKLKAAGIAPFMFGTGQLCNDSWYERIFSSELLHSDLAKFNVDHQQVAGGLDTAVAIHKGIISMKNPAYADGWKLLAQLQPYVAPGASTYDACSAVDATAPPLSEIPPFVQGKFAMVWGGTWYFPQLDAAGFKGKYGVFPVPTIMKDSSPYSSQLDMRGTVGGPNGSGEMSVTTPKANSSMTPEKLAQIADFLAFVYAPKNEGSWVADESSNSDVPVIKGATAPSIPGVELLIAPHQPPNTVEGILDGGLTAQATNSGIRLLQSFLNGQTPYAQFADQWQSILDQAANAWAQKNKVDLSKY